MNTLMQNINMHSIGNARELGGYPSADGRKVRQGVLLRTARLSTASADDLDRLREVYRLEKIIDLRSAEEVDGSPEIALFTGTAEPDRDPVIDGAEYIHLPILDLHQQMQDTYKYIEDNDRPPISDFFTMINVSYEMGYLGDELYFMFLDSDTGKRSYSRFFRELLTLGEGRSVIFHCTQGKDRTGVAAMLILSALGVSEKVIIEDYMLTNIYNAEKIAAERRMLESTGKLTAEQVDFYMRTMDEVTESTMTHVMAHLKEKYGSVCGYIVSELGMTDADIDTLKNKFLV